MPLAVSCQPSRGHVRVRATCRIDGPADCSSPSTGEMLRVTRAPDSHCWVVTALHQCRKAASRSWWGHVESLGRNLWAPGCCKPQFPSQDSTIEPESRTFSVVPVLGQSRTYLLGYLCVHEWLNSKNLSQKSVGFGQERTSGNSGLWKLSAATEMWLLSVFPRVCMIRAVLISCMLAKPGSLQALCFHPIVTGFAMPISAEGWHQPTYRFLGPAHLCIYVL